MTPALAEAPLFWAGPVPITGSFLTSLGITAALGAASFALTRRLTLEPSRTQTALEVMVSTIDEQIRDVVQRDPTERTREIGVRLAIGARAGDILTQFLVEATTLSTIGGFIGILFGLGGGYAVSRGLALPYVVPGIAAPVAFCVSVLVGVVFGVVPARKASRLNPLAALRFE